MQVEYDILTNVLFRHQYFSSSKLECLTVRAGKSTEEAMLNNGLICKSFKDGFALLYETLHNGEQREAAALVSNALTLRFYLTLTDANFFNYTEGNMENISASVFYFHNNSINRSSSFSDKLLHPNEFVSETDISSGEEVGEHFFTKPFGIIDISIHKDLQTEYSIDFKEKQTYWRYVLLGDHLKDLQKPAILGEQEIFAGPDKILLPDKREALSFVSSIPISLKQAALKQFKLVENYENESSAYRVVIRSLPAPDTARISSLGNVGVKNERTTYSEIFIY